MKRIALTTVGLAAVVGGAGYVAHVTHPDEFNQTTAAAAKALLRVWQSIEANPLPVAVALGTFVLTVIYHKLKGKTLRESVEVAATRVTVVTASSSSSGDASVRARASASSTSEPMSVSRTIGRVMQPPAVW